MQLFSGKSAEDLPKKRKMVQMSLRLLERMPRDVPPKSVVTVEKNYLFSENNLFVQAKLDSGVYSEGDSALVSLVVRRPGGHGVRRLRVNTVQQVGVAMFSTGNFKNSVGLHVEDVDPTDSCFKVNFKIFRLRF